MKKIFFLPIFIFSFCIVYTQNVGIGTTTPAAKLHIKGSADASQLVIDANATQSNTQPLIRLRAANGTDLSHIHTDNANNIFVGLNAGRQNNATGGGIKNTFMGSLAGSSNTTGNSNTAIGYQSLGFNTTGSENTAVGLSAMYSNSTGILNTANGQNALYSNISGSSNSAIGYNALYFNNTGNGNTGHGSYTLYQNIAGGHNTAIGYQALYANTVSDNTGIGYHALYNNSTGTYNTASGSEALASNSTGIANTATGNYALMSTTSGTDNTATGTQALLSNTTGLANTAVGSAALGATTASNYNTALGFGAGGILDNGYNNVFLGANANASQPGMFNVIAIGKGTVCTASSQVTIGNSSTVSYRAYANWSNISDGRFKKNIQENVPGLDFINQLRPVTYNINAPELDAFLGASDSKATGQLHKRKVTQQNDAAAKAIDNKALQEKEAIVYTGFIAQEVETTAKKLGFNFSGVDAPANSTDVYGLRYAEFVVPLVKAVQEQQQMIAAMQKRMELLEEQNKMLQQLIKK